MIEPFFTSYYHSFTETFKPLFSYLIIRLLLRHFFAISSIYFSANNLQIYNFLWPLLPSVYYFSKRLDFLLFQTSISHLPINKRHQLSFISRQWRCIRTQFINPFLRITSFTNKKLKSLSSLLNLNIRRNWRRLI